MAAGGKKQTKRSGAALRTTKASNKMKKTPSKMQQAPTRHLNSKIVKPAHRSDSKITKPAHRHGTLNSMWRNQLLGDADVRRWLIRSVGENAIHVIQEFEAQMSDEEIAQKSSIRASEVRVVLNKLHSFGLATYVRNRDRNSGWYSYIWKLNNEHVPELLAQIKKEGVEGVVVEEAREAGVEYYGCQTCGPSKRFEFDQASNLLFRCDQCGQNLKYLEDK
jgi:transcription initiation factor TFIIE subunit alpha